MSLLTPNTWRDQVRQSLRGKVLRADREQRFRLSFERLENRELLDASGVLESVWPSSLEQEYSLQTSAQYTLPPSGSDGYSQYWSGSDSSSYQDYQNQQYQQYQTYQTYQNTQDTQNTQQTYDSNQQYYQYYQTYQQQQQQQQNYLNQNSTQNRAPVDKPATGVPTQPGTGTSSGSAPNTGAPKASTPAGSPSGAGASLLAPPILSGASQTWVAVGPTLVTQGQVEGMNAQQNPVAGAVQTVAAHPTNPDILYIGSVNGGIWRTTNATSPNIAWTPVVDEQPSLSISTIEFDPTDPTGNTLIAGTGRYSSLALQGGSLTGLLRTTDGGDTWNVINGGLAGKNISGVAARGNTIVVSVDIADSFLFSNIGIFRSTDGGASFQQVSGTGLLPLGRAYDLASDPNDPNALYTAIRDAGVNNGIYKSNDMGATWARISFGNVNNLISDGPFINTDKVELAVGRHNQLYVGIINDGQLAAIFRAGNGGQTFVQMQTPFTIEGGIQIGVHPVRQAGGQGFIHFSIIADPTDPFIVYVGGDRQPGIGDPGSTFPNSIGAQNYSGRLFRGDASLPLLQQWNHLTHSPTLLNPAGGTASNSSPHADSRDMVFDAAGNLIEGDDGGVYKRVNPRSNTGDWVSINGNLQITEFHSVDWDATSNIVIGGTQDTGTSETIVAGGTQFRTVSQGDGGVVAVDDSNPNQSVRYSSFQFLGAFRRRVVDNNNNVLSVVFPQLTGLNGSPQFYTPIVINRINPNRLLFALNENIFETLNQANSFNPVLGTVTQATTMVYGGFQNGIANPDMIWAGNSAGVFFRLTALDPLAANAAYTAAGGAGVRDLAVNPNDFGQVVVVDQNNRVWLTLNGGANWVNVTGNLNDTLLLTVEFIPGPDATQNTIVVGGRTGVNGMLVSQQSVWSEFGRNLPNALVADLVYDDTDRVLLVGTQGRGAFVINNVNGGLGLDFGDAPDSYGTTLAFNGARHTSTAGPRLGTVIDTENNGQPNATATGDDTNAADDEDGVVFSTPLIVGDVATVTVTVTGTNGRLDGWIDQNGNGIFEANEKVIDNQAVANGTNVINITLLPTAVVTAQTFARFRLSTAGNLAPTGAANDGEVEDYAVQIFGADWGDAQSTQTTRAQNGARHGATSTLLLGTARDVEQDAQPNSTATGDDIVGVPDDEDGVIFTTQLVAGSNATAQVTVSSAGGRLNAWIDFNNDGDFNDANEQIATNLVIGGTQNVNFLVPAASQLGNVNARFRLSTTLNLQPTGLAVDGEVEDYTVVVTGPDFGDAPDTFGTLLASNGPRHNAGTLILGTLVDSETDGQPNATATGDDANGLDDEDGVTFGSILFAGETATVDVTVTGTGGRLDAWIDFDNSGTFQLAEKIFNNVAVANGVNNLTFTVPTTAVAGLRFARFRLSTAGGLTPFGAATDGEVEDLQVQVAGVDWGDAPDPTFQTLRANNGPRHGLVTGGPVLGAGVTADADGQPNATATGDANDDGVVFGTFISGGQTTVTVNVTGAGGLLDAWFDFNNNGIFELAEKLFNNQAVAVGANVLTVNVPLQFLPTFTTFARFRLSTAGGTTPRGFAADGEVEDYQITVQPGTDFDDAPASYGAASHQLSVANVVLGALVDAETAGFDAAPGSPALGDDNNNLDDEDGVVFTSLLVQNQLATVRVIAGANSFLSAWIDFDNSGTFDDFGERIFDAVALTAGVNDLVFFVQPGAATPFFTYSRFRVTQTFAEAFFMSPADIALSGEVEDHDVVILTNNPDFGDAIFGFPTLLEDNGPFHADATALQLGALKDGEPDGQPSFDDDGDDLTGLDDEDGVVVSTAGVADLLVRGEQATFSITVNGGPGRLDAWLDLNGDFDWADPGEQIFTNVAVVNGVNNLTFTIPTTANVGFADARFRLSSVGGLGFTGPALDGEVEDHLFTIVGADYGDAPAPFPTLFANNGARHAITATGIFLGADVDGETNGQPTANADGDDVNDRDDEDGVDFGPLQFNGFPVLLKDQNANLVVTSSGAGFLDAWIDFNRDGDWNDAGEQIFTNQALVGGANNLAFFVPNSATNGQTFLRFRAANAAGEVTAPTGFAPTGEVEDYTAFVFSDPPRVQGVSLDGTTWAAPAFNFPANTAGNQLNPLPFTGTNQIVIRFSENVQIDLNDLTLTGINVPNYTISAFNYNNVTFTATWTLTNPIVVDSLTITLNADAAGFIQDADGNPLDGEWSPFGQAFPSGNFVPGGNFVFRFNVLTGDVTGDGQFNLADAQVVHANIGHSAPSPFYNRRADLNNDGRVDMVDYYFAHNLLLGTQQSLPAGSGFIPPAAPIAPTTLAGSTPTGSFTSSSGATGAAGTQSSSLTAQALDAYLNYSSSGSSFTPEYAEEEVYASDRPETGGEESSSMGAEMIDMYMMYYGEQ